jgi:hypothetical protein
MRIRIGISGSSGTGKSTLARFISDTYGLPMNPVGSRSTANEMGFESPYDVDKAGRREEFQRRLQASKIAWETSHESFVTDRTTLDELVYTTFHDVKTACSASYYDAAIGHMSRYDMVFYCPADKFLNLDGDPKRLDDIRYQKNFDRCLFGHLMQIEPHWFYKMFSAKLKHREEQIAEAIDLFTTVVP